MTTVSDDHHMRVVNFLNLKCHAVLKSKGMGSNAYTTDDLSVQRA